MKNLALVLLVLASSSMAQVPDSITEVERAAAYIVYNDGMIRYIPNSHEVVIQPKGWNTAPFSWENMLGIKENRWPFLDYLCKPQLSTGGPVPARPSICSVPRYVVRK